MLSVQLVEADIVYISGLAAVIPLPFCFLRATLLFYDSSFFGSSSGIGLVSYGRLYYHYRLILF